MKKAALFLIFFLIALIILPGGTASWKDTLYMEGVLRYVSNPVNDEDEEGDLTDWFNIKDPSEQVDEPGSNEMPKKEEGQPEKPADNNNGQEVVEDPGSDTGGDEDKKSVFTVTLAADPVDGGSVNAAGSYEAGKTVMVTAKPAKDYIFRGWFENEEIVSKESNYSFTVGSDRNLKALFIKTEVSDPDIPGDEPEQEKPKPSVKEPDKSDKSIDKKDTSDNKTNENIVVLKTSQM